jgi:hypothetical protein
LTQYFNISIINKTGLSKKLATHNFTFALVYNQADKQKMKIHLIKTPEYDAKDFIKIVDVLSPYNGIVTFTSATSSFDDAVFLASFPHLQNNFQFSWNDIFHICNVYRSKFRISNDDFVVLLTNRRNERNWFSSIDRNLERNIFVQTSEWDLFVECAPEYPIVYEIVANILQNLMQADINRFEEFVHWQPKGCINDFCGEKSEIILKLRTADVCRVCLDKLYQHVSPFLVKFFTKILEGIRPNMLERINHVVDTYNLGRLSIEEDYRLFVCHPDFEKIEITLSPTQKAIYFLFLNHAGGIKFKEMVNHKPEFSRIYKELTKSEDAEKIQLTIDKICNGQQNNFRNLNTYISQIEKIFTDKLGGHKDLIRYFCITGEREKAKKIALDRTRLTIHKNNCLISQS